MTNLIYVCAQCGQTGRNADKIPRHASEVNYVSMVLHCALGHGPWLPHVTVFSGRAQLSSAQHWLLGAALSPYYPVIVVLVAVMTLLLPH